MSAGILLSIKYLCIHLSYCEIMWLKRKPWAEWWEGGGGLGGGDSDQMWHRTAHMLTSKCLYINSNNNV